MVERSYETEAWKSPLAARIFQLIYTEEATYPSKIAAELGSKPQTVSNYLSGMRSIGFVERAGKSGRKQTYSADTDLIIEYWFKNLRENLEEELELVDEDSVKVVDQLREDFESHEEEIKSFTSQFVNRILNDYRLNKDWNYLLIEEFAFSMLYVYLTYVTGDVNLDEETLEWFDPLVRTLIRFRTKGDTIQIMYNLLENNKE